MGSLVFALCSSYNPSGNVNIPITYGQTVPGGNLRQAGMGGYGDQNGRVFSAFAGSVMSGTWVLLGYGFTSGNDSVGYVTASLFYRIA